MLLIFDDIFMLSLPLLNKITGKFVENLNIFCHFDEFFFKVLYSYKNNNISWQVVPFVDYSFKNSQSTLFPIKVLFTEFFLSLFRSITYMITNKIEIYYVLIINLWKTIYAQNCPEDDIFNPPNTEICKVLSEKKKLLCWSDLLDDIVTLFLFARIYPEAK